MYKTDTMPSTVILVLVAPFIRPANRVGDTPPLPYYLYCLIGIAVIAFGVLYWVVWQLVLPYVFKFRFVPRKEVLEDGTVVALVGYLTAMLHGDKWLELIINSVLQRSGGEDMKMPVARNSSGDDIIGCRG